MDIFKVNEFVPGADAVFADRRPPADIRVIGSGSGGSNAINHMIDSKLLGVQFTAVNTDKQHLDDVSRAKNKLQIGGKQTGGRGAGGDPAKGEDAANEDRERISEVLRGADMVFITTGMGGGTGTGSAPVIAKVAKELNLLTVAIVTTPFAVEGLEKMNIALEGIKKLREIVDIMIIIPNENIFKLVDRKTSVRQALKLADDILYHAVKGITDLITKTGLINTDFADVESTMRGQGDAHLGIGRGSGDARAIEAANSALDNRLLEEVSIEGATRLLVNIAGPEEISMVEVNEILNTIRTRVGSGAKLKFGITFDPELGEEVQVTVIATGFTGNRPVLARNNEETQKKANNEAFVIDLKQFDEMRGMGEKRQNDNYIGLVRNKEYRENLDVPTAIRKYNPETDDNQTGKTAYNRKEA